MPLSVKPLHPLFAAEVTGLDLRRPASATEARAFVAAMDQCGVGVLPEQFIDDEQQVAFARLFGELEMRPIQRGRNRYPGADERIRHHEIFDVSNLDAYGKMLPPGDERRAYSLANRLWHTDSSFRQVSATYSMLSARIIPPEDADTEFADMRAAYDALPQAMKARLEGRVAHHSIWHSRPGAFHPLVRRHPSGRTTLYLASHASEIVDMEHEEASALLHELIQFATEPRFIYRHKWRAGDLVVWDNRCTMHRATPFEDTAHVRDMRRTTVRDNEAALTV
jgi:alpha-ketoglutarate-dependent 2,4-dichlorophenoxyacetate dioxygenase